MHVQLQFQYYALLIGFLLIEWIIAILKYLYIAQLYIQKDIQGMIVGRTELS